jgi:hypothetical protein
MREMQRTSLGVPLAYLTCNLVKWGETRDDGQYDFVVPVPHEQRELLHPRQGRVHFNECLV